MNAEGLKELFEPLGAVMVKRMFGGHGVYAEGLCFAIESDGEVFLKVDAQSEPSFVKAGSSPFVYMAKGKPMTTSYWRLPPAAHEEAEELIRWAALGLGAARRAAEAKGEAGEKGRADAEKQSTQIEIAKDRTANPC
jgi:DNA transformation protein